jgi:hypothetical protein
VTEQSTFGIKGEHGSIAVAVRAGGTRDEDIHCVWPSVISFSMVIGRSLIRLPVAW